MPPGTNCAMRRITPQEARAAIYIDFERLQGQSPSVLGVLEETSFHQIVLDGGLRTAAEAKDLKVESGERAILQLRERALDEGRRVCAFSTHELTVCSEHFSVDLSDVYVNGLKVLRRWWHHCRPDETLECRSQAAFERAMGLERPPHLACGNAAQRLRHVRNQLAARGDHSSLTPTAKAKWTKLLAYNRLDVVNLAELVRRAAVELADGSRTLARAGGSRAPMGI
jgi:hypothetical protein